MKSILIVLILIIITVSVSRSQGIDTVQTFAFGKMPPVYFENKLYWEKNYDSKNHLQFEGLSYNSCHVGAFINYHKNGSVKTKGQYKENTTGDWSNLNERGLCSVPDGEWKSYSETGELKSTIIYEDGKIVKEY
jgi:antitoxin component YwqK of YwqJK toxin-antitoxin module